LIFYIQVNRSSWKGSRCSTNKNSNKLWINSIITLMGSSFWTPVHKNSGI